MELERKTTTYGEDTYTRLIGRGVTSIEEVAVLAEVIHGGDYFYGGVLDTGSELHVYFGQGPRHDIFEQMIQESSGMRGKTSVCQIGVKRTTNTIRSIIFIEDPGKDENRITIDDNDVEGKKRRRSRILAVVRALSPDLCEPKVDVGWEGEGDHVMEYAYLPQNDLLQKG